MGRLGAISHPLRRQLCDSPAVRPAHPLLMAVVLLAAGCYATPQPLDPTGDPDIPDLPGDDDDASSGDDDDTTPDPGDDDDATPPSDDDDAVDDDDTTPDDGDDDDDLEPDCPPGVTCLDTFPAVVAGDTSLSSVSDFDAYGCAPGTDESGPEVLYRVDLATEGFLALSIDWIGPGVDVDVHLLGSLDPADCADRGHWTAGARLPAGSYWVVVDSWVDDGGSVYDGAYDLIVNHVPVDAFAPDGIDPGLMDLALTAFDNGWFDGETDRFEFTFIDFSLPSTEPRLWTVDLLLSAVLHNLHVSHGEASGVSGAPELAGTFSNVSGSHQSSLGLMRTAETYTGSKGYSMRLDGLEPDYNGLVRPRAIVVHGAEYARPEFAATNGYLGRSWGCPAIDDRLSADLIDDISGGTLMLSYYPDGDWDANSDYLE